MTAKKKPTALDAPWPHHHITAPILFTGAVLGAAGVLRATLVSPWWVVAVTAVAAVMSPMIAAAFDSPLRTRWYVALVAVAAGAWLTWTRFTTPWSRAAVLVLIAAAVVLGPWWAVIARATVSEAAKAAEAARRAARHAELARWPELLASLGFKGITHVARTDNPAGYSVTLRLPPDGSVLYPRLYGALERIEVAAGVRHNSLRLERGATAAEVVIHVFTDDVLAKTYPLPVVREPRSIHQPIPLGVFETGEVAVVTFREIAALMVGLRGSGKSALTNTHLAALTGCTDAVVWMIDGKGGRTARPWLEPFLKGVTGRPAIDWVATTDDEVDAMLAGAKAAVVHRSTGEGEKIIPSPGKPAIILIVEEASMVFGTRKLSNNKRSQVATDVVVLGRSEAVDVLIMAQRGTVTMLGSGDMKSQLNLRYGLGVASQGDASSVFPDTKMAAELFKLAGDNYRGAFLMQAPGSARVLPVKGYWTDPELVAGIAQTNAEFRPDLDRDTGDAVHAALVEADVPGGYWGRWERYTDTVSRPGDMSPVPVGDTSPGQPVSPVSPLVEKARAKGDPKGLTTAERLGLPPSTIVPSPLSPVTEDKEFADIVRHWGETAEPERPRDTTGQPANTEVPVPQILVLVARVFTVLRAEKLHTARILQELPGEMTPKRLGLLLNMCGVAALPEAFVVDGQRARGYAATDVLRALGEARAGRKMLPGAYDWPDR